MDKLNQLLAVFTSLTGLTIDDALKVAEAKTEQEREEAEINNIVKMSEHLNAGKVSTNDSCGI